MVAMPYRETTQRLAQYRQQIAALRREMRELQQSIEPETVKDYELSTAGGTVRLSQLFGGKDHLFIIHNMGASCPMCTLWADGFNGILPHLEDRAAFVVASPDEPEKQEKFKASRGWRFRMVSHQNTSFATDMGYRGADGWLPGISVFAKRGGAVVRVSDTRLGPGDDFCALWHFFDLLPEGAQGWKPKYKYA
jgi:predicted dithiol-disulfide oxidoreductase (DUF899 family)